jgi:hypothetical protein
LANLTADLLFGPAKLQRAKSHFVKNRGRKKLDIRILEYQSHPAVKLEAEFQILQTILGEWLAIE